MEQVEYSFEGYNNTKIYAKKDLVDKPKANVVIVHGIFEHLKRYDYLVSKLNEEGYNVYRYDARGHGRSEGLRGDLENFEEFLLDLDIYIDSIRKEHPELKIVLLGHSMGGLVATSYASLYNNKIDYLILSGACNKTPKVAQALKLIPTCITAKLKYKNALGKGVCGDENVVKAYNEDPLVLKVGTLRLMRNAFIKGCKLVNNNIKNIKVPTLVMHGQEDGIVVVETGKWTYENLTVEDKILKIYPGLYHEIFNEVSKDEVIKDVTSWLNSRKMEDKQNDKKVHLSN